MHSLRDIPNIAGIRNIGLMAGIEIESRPDEAGARAYDAMVAACQRELLIRVTGDSIAISPPLIIETTQIDRFVEILRAVLQPTLTLHGPQLPTLTCLRLQGGCRLMSGLHLSDPIGRTGRGCARSADSANR